MSRIACPEVRNWQALLEGDQSEEEIDGLAHHLETCGACRQTLESLAIAPAVWEDTARVLGEQRRKAGQEPALRHVVERLKEEDSPVREEDLSFLRPADAPDLLGLLGSYQVQEVIGRGGMGVVLKAFDPVLHRLVAIKVLDPALADSATARRRFQRETQAAAAVCHDHVVAVHGVSEAGGLPYLVMQYVAGESLQARLDRAGPLDVSDIVRIGLQTASGLAAAHVQGLIHRDVKPANLLLENGLTRIKITDFGLARMADDVGLTQNGVVAGTPEYMAPEQARGEVVDHRADLFGLGCVLYACCTGSSPFRGATALAVLARVREEEPTPIRSLNPDVPAWLETFIARLLAKNPAQRFQSAAEAATLLESYLAHLCQPATVLAPALVPLPLPLQRQGDTEMSFACSGCGTKLKARTELAGKQVKCPHCGHSVLVPTPEPNVPKEAKYTAWIIWLAASLGLVLLLLVVWFCWPGKSAPPAFLDVTLGHQFVPGVEESGFYHDEENEMGSFRWTDGRGRLVIPLDKREPPQALFVQLQRPKNSWLQIAVNDRQLVDERPIDRDMTLWERTLDLSGIDLREKLVVEIVSNTVVPAALHQGKSDDTRPLGVVVRAIKAQRQGGRDETAPVGNSFLDVTLGHRFVPGVDDSGFYHDELDKEGRFRWTNGKGKLVIPLDKTSPLPKALWVQLERQKNSFLQIAINQRALVNEPANKGARWWERTFALSGIDLGEKLIVEIVSGTSIPANDPRAIGVQVRGIKLLREIDGKKISSDKVEVEAK